MEDPAKNPYAASSTQRGATNFGGGAPGTINGAARIGTVITLALVSGVVMMSAIMSFLVLSDPPEEESLFRFDGDAMLFLGVGYVVFLGGAFVAIVMRGLMKGQAAANLRSAGEDFPQPLDGNSSLPPSGRAFVGAFATYTLIGQALLEGPAVINVILMFIENNFAHAIPIVLAIIGILLQIPTAGRIKSAIENTKL